VVERPQAVPGEGDDAGRRVAVGQRQRDVHGRQPGSDEQRGASRQCAQRLVRPWIGRVAVITAQPFLEHRQGGGGRVAQREHDLLGA
jgi:hypothetical protein